MRDGYSIYDTHAHLGLSRHSGRACDRGQLLAVMDRCGIDRALVIPYPVVEDYHAAHDEIARAVESSPDRLAGAASLYPFIPEDEYRAEVGRCARQLGFRALKLQPQYHPLNPISPRSAFVFEAAREHGLPLICHTGTGAPYALPSLFVLPARRYPDLPIVLAHSGGGLYVAEAIVAAVVCPNIHLDLSSLMPHHIAEVLAHVPPERLVIGTDLPENAETEISKILGLDAAPNVKRLILWENARRLFGGEG